MIEGAGSVRLLSRLLMALLTALTALALAAATAAAEPVSPGEPGADQYTEGVPEADGKQPGRGSQGPEGAEDQGDSGGPGADAGGGTATGVRNLPIKTLSGLREDGPGAEDVIAALNASTPNGERRRRADAKASDPRAKAPVGAAPGVDTSDATGDDVVAAVAGAVIPGGDGLGFLFPLIAGAILGAAFAVRRARNAG